MPRLAPLALTAIAALSLAAPAAIAQVPGDECSNALTATIGTNSVNTTTMTPSADAPYPDKSCPSLGWTPTTKDAWFRFDAPTPGLLTLDLCESGFDTSVVLYRGECGQLERMGCDDDGCVSSSRSRIMELPIGSGEIFIRVGGKFSASGPVVLGLHLDPEMPAAVVGWGTSQPAIVPADLGGIRKVAAGFGHGVAIRSDGAVRCWGLNSDGQSTVPEGLPEIIAISAGGWAEAGSEGFTVAISTDGVIHSWGSNTYGQCNVPPSPLPWRSIEAGGSHVVGVDGRQVVHCWGNNWYGQSSSPIITGPRDIAAGTFHSVAILNDGSALCWGRNEYGESTPPAGLFDLTAVAAGDRHVVSLRSNGTVACWGSNSAGQCTPPPGLGIVTDVRAGGFGSYALLADGGVMAWGIPGHPGSSLGEVADVAVGNNAALFLVRRDCDLDGINDPLEILTSDCNGNRLHDCWDQETGLIEDCDGNGLGDTCQKQVQVSVESPQLSPIGFNQSRDFQIADAVPAVGPFWITVEALGDFDAYLEYLTIRIGDHDWEAFRWGSLCSGISVSFEITPEQFNSGIAPNGTWRCDFTTSSAVDPLACPKSSWVKLSFSYTGAAPSDCDGNGRLDSCQIADGSVPDTNGNGIIDTCENQVTACPTDFDADRRTGPSDLSVLLGSWGSSGANGTDLNGDGTVSSGDLAILLGAWGDCPVS